MHSKILFASVLALLATNCTKPVDPPIPADPFAPEKHEEVKVSFLLGGEDTHIELAYPLCQRMSYSGRSLDYGGALGFHYENTFRMGHEPIGGVSNALISYRLYGDELPTSYPRIGPQTMHEIHNGDVGGQWLVNFSFDYGGRRYAIRRFNQIIPFPIVSIEDSESVEGLFFLEEHWILKCLENHSVLPTRFTYSGYVYTQGRQDSLKIQDFEAFFPILALY